jgi:hypothetical protein
VEAAGPRERRGLSAARGRPTQSAGGDAMRPERPGRWSPSAAGDEALPARICSSGARPLSAPVYSDPASASGRAPIDPCAGWGVPGRDGGDILPASPAPGPASTRCDGGAPLRQAAGCGELRPPAPNGGGLATVGRGGRLVEEGEARGGRGERPRGRGAASPPSEEESDSEKSSRRLRVRPLLAVPAVPFGLRIPRGVDAMGATGRGGRPAAMAVLEPVLLPTGGGWAGERLRTSGLLLARWIMMFAGGVELSLGRSTMPKGARGEALRGGICPGGLREENVVIGLGEVELRAGR